MKAMKRVYVPTQSGSDWQRLLAKPDLHWKIGRSAMTAAACWEAAGDGLPPEITALFQASQQSQLNDLALLAALPEWQVKLPGGERPSCTDVLALTRNAQGLCVVAVEAKVDEDFGPTVGQKRKEASDGQTARLDYLHSLLEMRASEDGLRYQLLHRTASAILAARDFHAQAAVMLVHSFGSNPSVVRDFDAFCKAIRAEPLPGGMHVVRSVAHPTLYLGWCDGDKRFCSHDLPALSGSK